MKTHVSVGIQELLERRAPPRVHLVGLRGTGVRSLADFLLCRGWRVGGSDVAFSEREQQGYAARGVVVQRDHSARNITADLDLVVYSLAVPPDNPERLQAASLGIRTVSYVEFLGELTRLMPTLGVAGTHGKTTTCCLLKHVLREAGQGVEALCGGRLLQDEPGGASSSAGWLIAECCEFRQAFLGMHPRFAALLGVEPDHFDCYADTEALVAAFGEFCGQLPSEGKLVVNADSPLAVRAARGAVCPVEYFSLQPESCVAAALSAMWRVDRIQAVPTGMSFRLRGPMGAWTPFHVPLFGAHQVANTVAAVVLLKTMGVGDAEIQAGLRNFPGVERRFQGRGSYRGWSLWDDYAHHPSEIEATLAAARLRFGGHPLTVAFQPHQILRTRKLLPDFARSLAAADRVLILPIFAAREHVDEQTVHVARELVDRGNSISSVFEFCPTLDHLRSMLDDTQFNGPKEQQPVFLTLGAGDIDRIFNELPR
ncbi:MAG: Mur ligase family protein [Planctomycetaceae bacterium]|nr:hypothetical protein [Planctomycetaceae bacterium]